MSDALEAQAPGGESLLKPHPFLLQRAADALDPTGTQVAAYVGDAPDDIIAARRADAAARAAGSPSASRRRPLRPITIAAWART